MANASADHRSSTWRSRLSRRSLLRGTASAATVAATAGTMVSQSASAQSVTSGTPASPTPATSGAVLRPVDAMSTMLAAVKRYPVVALGENHRLQEFHDFLTALLFHPALPDELTDFVVEFGNALFQDVADRFVLSDEPVANAELTQIWRNIPATLYNAPVYAQFFRSVRAVNWTRPPAKRRRVLLGLPPVDFRRVRSLADKTYALAFNQQYNVHMADVIENEVLKKGRRALFVAGSAHTMRGLRDSDQPGQLNTAAILEQRHPGALYSVAALTPPYNWLPGDGAQRLQAAIANWPRPSLTLLSGTWLGATPSYMSYRAATPGTAPYEAQADALLYLGPADLLTISLEDASLYQCGDYAAELRRLSPLLGQIFGGGAQFDLAGDAIKLANGSPLWIDQFSR